MAPPPGRDGLPAGFGIALDPGTRWIGDDALVGGSPLRLLRFTGAGRALVDRLANGEALPASPAAQRLARRLLDAGVAHPRPPAAPDLAVAVVIPVHDDAAGLAATLDTLSAPAGPPVVVVDDASADPGAVEAVCRRPGITVRRRDVQGGPGAARNDGWRATQQPLIAFVDANCEPEAGWLDVLLPHFADPRVAAVAPRIVPVARPGTARWLARYDAACSPLDLGAGEAVVRPRSPVAYVPTAALVVRRAALEELGGFDPTLTVGEDVDFVWRLVAAGWTVRYEPRAVVRHPVRPAGPAWLRQRYRYGTSAGPLGRRHGAAVAPVGVSPWTAAAWTAAAAGHPHLGITVAGASVAWAAGRTWRPVPAAALPPGPGAAQRAAAPGPGPKSGEPGTGAAYRPEPDAAVGPGPRRTGVAGLPGREAARLVALGHLRGGLALARAVRRAWAPPALVLAVRSRRFRPALAAAAVVPALVDWRQRRPRLDPLRFVALRLADDLAYAAGVWAGCLRERSIRALCPDLRIARPGPGEPD